MIWLHFGIKQMKIGESMDVLHSFTWNYVKYAKMEGFRRDGHIYIATLTHIHCVEYSRCCVLCNPVVYKNIQLHHNQSFCYKQRSSFHLSRLLIFLQKLTWFFHQSVYFLSLNWAVLHIHILLCLYMHGTDATIRQLVI